VCARTEERAQDRGTRLAQPVSRGQVAWQRWLDRLQASELQLRCARRLFAAGARVMASYSAMPIAGQRSPQPAAICAPALIRW
jgi:hypothetical protein